MVSEEYVWEMAWQRALGLALGGAREALGHGAEGLLGLGAGSAEARLGAGLSAFGGLQRCRNVGARHGGLPGVTPIKGFGFPAAPPRLPGADECLTYFLRPHPPLPPLPVGAVFG